MLKPIKLISLLIVVVVFSLVLILVTIESNANKTRVQTFASQALNKEVRIDGPLRISLLNGPLITLQDVHIFENGISLVSVNQAEISIALLPLLIGKVRILSIELSQPIISIDRDNDTKLPPYNPQSIEETSDVLEIAALSFTGATLTYSHLQAQTNLVALNCDLQMQQLRLVNGLAATILQSLSFAAELSCGEFQYNNYKGTELSVPLVAADGVISMAPVTMQIFGGHGTADIQTDFSGVTRKHKIHYVLPQLHLEGLLNTLPPEISAEGVLDLVLNMTLEGNSMSELRRSANGNVFLHGNDLTLGGIDLDEKFEKFESSQNFSLIDAGAFFFAGPLGLLATKGYDFTALLQQTGGSSEIHRLISDWTIVDGLAQSVDVALAARHNRVALDGQLDLVNKVFVDLTIALIDSDGCSVMQQEIGGSFAQPEVDQPGVFVTVAGPVLSILERGAALLTGNPCEVFYSGQVPET